MKNKTKYLVAILLMLVSFLLIGVTNVNATTITVENEEELINASKGIDSEINEIKLTKDITLTKFLNFYVVNDITLELNGQTLDIGSYGLSFNYGQSDYDESNNNYYYNFNSKLTIKDSSSSKTGKILSRQNIFFNYYDTNHDEEIKKFGLTIDGGYYEMISSSPNFFEFFSRDYYTNGRNLNVDVKVKDAVFKLNDGMYLFGTISNSASDIKLNFNFESLKVLGLTSKLGSLKLGEMKLDEVIDPNSKAYFQKLPYTTGAPVLAEADRNTLVRNFYATGGSDPYIIIKKVNGFEINNVEINETYKETPNLNGISIKNISDNDLQIQNVTVDSSNFVVEGPSTKPTVSAGATNTDYKIRAIEGLPVGTYTATITVTDSNGNYTATVTLKVEKKNYDGVVINYPSNWIYNSNPTLSITGLESLGSNEYEIYYSKETTPGNYENIGNTLPILVGKYKVNVKITSVNYIESESSVDFEIKPITTEVKVKSYDETFDYDGTYHTKNTYDVLWANNASPVAGNILLNGDKVTAEITGKVRDVKDTALENNTIEKITITNAEGVDVTDCYSNKVKAAGKLTVNKKDSKITVTSEGANQAYDGSPLTNNNKTVTGEIVAGEEVVVEFTGSQTYVGTSDNEFNVKVMRGSDDVTDNYTFGTHTFGKLTVTSAEQPLAITDQYVRVNGSISKGYLEQSVTGNVGNIDFTIKSGTALTYDSTNEEYVAGATEGDVVMTVTAVKVDLGGDGTPEWKETTKDFTVHVVNKENVTITGLEDNQVFTFDNTTKTPWGTGTITVEGNKVDVNELDIFYNGTGSTTYSSKFAPVDAGTYTITYKVKDSNPNYVGSVTYTFTIKKAQLNKPTASTTSFVYDGTSKGYSSFHDSEVFEFTGTNTATNVGNYSLTISLKDKDNYEWKDGTTTDVVINWSITQATPEFTVPTGLTGVKGDFLSSITLPAGFTWNNPSELLTAGTHTYKATYTPTDTINYKTVTDIEISVVVKNKFVLSGVVNGGNGTISVSSLEVLEGKKAEVIFTPDEGYMIDKVLVEGTEVEVTGNQLELTMDGHKLVVVSYKKIPFTVTVEDVEGATVDPSGVVTVNYGDNKNFTITANSGYKLIKVLVNGTEKTLDGNTLKLKNITSNMKIKVVVEKIEYKVIEGAEQTYTITEDTEARFRIDADYSLFNNKVYVDNVLVDSSNYTSKSGSTIIVLNKDYVDTLAVGEHTLKVAFADGGEAETTFTIAKKAENNNNNENNTPSKPEDKEEMKDNGSNPKTGDNIMLYVAIASMSIIGLVATTIVAKKKKMN